MVVLEAGMPAPVNEFPVSFVLIYTIRLIVYAFLSYNWLIDLFPNEQNFDLDKSRQTFHHSLKEHHKISNIPKFRCEML
jgi:hypothetical protein